MTYRQFTEHNPHEGEHWHFWLQVDGNEAELDRLKEYLLPYLDDEPEFYFEGRDLTEAEVDLLVEFCEEGYMPSHQKVTGVLKCPTLFWEARQPEEWFYKGGIKGHFYES